MNFKNGLEEGNWIKWRENGQIHFKGKYSDGKMEGSWLYHSNNGSLIKRHSGFIKTV